MNFSEFPRRYLEEIKRRSAGMPDMGDVDYGSTIGRGGVGAGFDTAKYNGYMGRENDEIAGGNYGNPVNQHPHGRRGAYNDLKTGRAQPGGGVYEAAVRGLLDKKESPLYGGTNEELRRWYAQNPWALGR